jgi:molecular chaperone GrpE
MQDNQQSQNLDRTEDGGETPSDALQVEQAAESQLALEQLKQELLASQGKAEEYLEGWQRARADFANYKKRIERDQAQNSQMVTGSILKRYLEIVDDLDRALKNRPQAGEGASWANGIELIYRKLMTTLENEGVKPIDALGKEFDPTQHEAILSEENNQFKSGHVTEVLQQGYMLGDRVLRPAVVKVAR